MHFVDLHAQQEVIKEDLDHRIRNEKDFNQHVEYIRMNPVKHGYIQETQEWRWCFIHQRPFG